VRLIGVTRGGPEAWRRYHEQWHEDQHPGNRNAQHLVSCSVAIAVAS